MEITYETIIKYLVNNKSNEQIETIEDDIKKRREIRL
jgi:hypothetical protein